MTQNNFFGEFETKMRSAGISDAGIKAFENNYNNLAQGKTGMIPETSIDPVESLPAFEEVASQQDKSLLSETVILKLNGGLGTGMGLAGPKSLLPLKGELTFLDFIAKQILHFRKEHNLPLRFLLMNSFSTTEETLMFLRKYPELGAAHDLELMQGSVPKVDANTLRPVSWPADPELEWCPPGHGDLYPSILGSGWLKKLLDAGVRYMFVSNSDNLGASLDLGLLTWFARSNKSFVMEVAVRTSADKKGGHLAKSKSGGLLLRESAQCPAEDMEAFQDITRHRYFNTNNLWIRLDHLRDLLIKNGGLIPLPMIRNAKTVDPRDKKSTPVVQLETAMGAAIECFSNAGAVQVPRSRFAPVKTTSDLLVLRSDAYEISPDWRLVLNPECNGVVPVVDLDGDHYKIVDQLDQLAPVVPSLKKCHSLKVKGPVLFQEQIKLEGKVELVNSSGQGRVLGRGTYRDQTVQL